MPIDDEDLIWAIQDTCQETDRWTQLSLESILRSAELQYKNRDREFNLILALTSLSVAFLTLFAPNILGQQHFLITLSAIFSLLTSITGICLLIITIKRDDRLIKSDGQWESETYRTFQTEAGDLLSLLREYKKSPNEELENTIAEKVTERRSAPQHAQTEADIRTSQKEREFSAIVLRSLYLLFWLFFIVSLAAIVGWLFGSLLFS